MHTPIKRVLESKKIARVEGNGKIMIELEKDTLKSVKVNIYEGSRLIEKIVEGKSIDEVISIVPRICAICNLSHKFATVTAMQNATLTQPSRHAEIFFKLMHMGEMIESHTLHLYLLVLPDLFKVNNAVELLDEHGTTVREGLILKKFGNKIMYLAGGNRGIHGENPKVGGFGTYPDIQKLKEIRKEAKQLLSNAIKLVHLLGETDFPKYPEIETEFICVDPDDEEFGFYGDHLITSTGKRVPAKNYNEIISERLVSHSYAKRALHEDKPFTVGAVARIILIGNRLHGEADKLLRTYYNERWKFNPFFNNMAQAIEIVYCIEQSMAYIDQLVELLEEVTSVPLPPQSRLSGRGVGLVEAPRGVLIHDYTLLNGRLTKANIITPTAMNLDDIEQHLLVGGQMLMHNGIDDATLQFNLEMLTRSYDPCISCSTHLVHLRRVSP